MGLNKKIIYLISLIVLICILFVACKGNSEQGETTAASSTSVQAGSELTNGENQEEQLTAYAVNGGIEEEGDNENPFANSSKTEPQTSTQKPNIPTQSTTKETTKPTTTEKVTKKLPPKAPEQEGEWGTPIQN